MITNLTKTHSNIFILESKIFRLDFHSNDYSDTSLQQMDATMVDNYDYNGTIHFIEPFENPLGEEPFITEMVSNYGTLWKFKECVKAWSFGVSRFKKYVYLRHCAHGTNHFLNWNIDEEVSQLENHHNDSVVMTLQLVNDVGVSLQHTHSIVFRVDQGDYFDLDALLAILPSTSSVAPLQEDF